MNPNFIYRQLSLLEIFLLQLFVYIAIWLWNAYVATLITFSITPMVCAVLLIALIAEGLERSRVPKRYFYIMAVSILAPLAAYAVMRTIGY